MNCVVCSLPSLAVKSLRLLQSLTPALCVETHPGCQWRWDNLCGCSSLCPGIVPSLPAAEAHPKFVNADLLHEYKCRKISAWYSTHHFKINRHQCSTLYELIFDSFIYLSLPPSQSFTRPHPQTVKSFSSFTPFFSSSSEASVWQRNCFPQDWHWSRLKLDVNP